MKNQTTLKKTKILTALLLLFFASFATSMAQGVQEVKNIVIVHGAFVDGSGWGIISTVKGGR